MINHMEWENRLTKMEVLMLGILLMEVSQGSEHSNGLMVVSTKGNLSTGVCMETDSTGQPMVKHTAALLSEIENKAKEDRSQHKEYTQVVLP